MEGWMGGYSSHLDSDCGYRKELGVPETVCSSKNGALILFLTVLLWLSMDLMIPWLGSFSFPSPGIHIVISYKSTFTDTLRSNVLVAIYLPEYCCTLTLSSLTQAVIVIVNLQWKFVVGLGVMQNGYHFFQHACLRKTDRSKIVNGSNHSLNLTMYTV